MFQVLHKTKKKKIMAKRVGPVGNYLGDAFDDGVFDGVKKIIVSVEGSPYNCISMIKIEYEKDGKLESRQHGTVRGELKEVKNGIFFVTNSSITYLNI